MYFQAQELGCDHVRHILHMKYYPGLVYDQTVFHVDEYKILPFPPPKAMNLALTSTPTYSTASSPLPPLTFVLLLTFLMGDPYAFSLKCEVAWIRWQ